MVFYRCGYIDIYSTIIIGMFRYIIIIIYEVPTLLLLKLWLYRPGGYFRNFWVGMCRWDPGTLDLYQS